MSCWAVALSPPHPTPNRTEQFLASNWNPHWSCVISYLDVLRQKVAAVTEEMVRLYPDSTAQEWIEEHVSPVMAPLQNITEDITACLKELVP